jgi:hypothetical protein
MYAEMRSVDTGWLSTAQRRLTDEIRAKAAIFDVDVEVTWSRDNECRLAAASIQEVVSATADSLGIDWAPVPSGATHDAVHLARLCPMGMIFIPSRAGRSHCPEEWSELSRHRDPDARGDADRARPRLGLAWRQPSVSHVTSSGRVSGPPPLSGCDLPICPVN